MYNHSPISGAPGDSFGPVAAKPILAILANDTPASGGRAAPSGPAPWKSPFSSGDPERPRDWAMAASRASSSVMPAAARAAAGLDGLGIACRHAGQVRHIISVIIRHTILVIMKNSLSVIMRHTISDIIRQIILVITEHTRSHDWAYH